MSLSTFLSYPVNLGDADFKGDRLISLWKKFLGPQHLGRRIVIAGYSEPDLQ